MVNALGQIVLSLFAEFKVLHCNLPDKLEVFLKFLALGQMVVVEFHASNLGICGRTHTERRHTTAVNVKGAIREEIQEQPIIGLLGIRDVLREVVVVAHGVESRRVVD